MSVTLVAHFLPKANIYLPWVSAIMGIRIAEYFLVNSSPIDFSITPFPFFFLPPFVFDQMV